VHDKCTAGAGALQAAVAQHYGLHLATRNTGDFNPKRPVFVVVSYKLDP